MSSPRPDQAIFAVRRLIAFFLAVCLSNAAVLLAQTNNSSGLSGNRTTSGANQAATSPSGLSGNRTTGGASQAATSPSGLSSNRTTGGGSQAASGNVGRGTGGSSVGNSGISGQNGFGQTYGNAAARARASAASAANTAPTQGGFAGGYSAPGTAFIFVGPAQANGGKPTPSQLGPGSGNRGQVLSQSSSAGQDLDQGTGQSDMPSRSDASSSPSAANTLTLGFEPAAAPASEVGSAIAERLLRLPALHFLTPVRVDFDGRTAILRGTVATNHDRDLAERVVLLEASVDEVVNLLTVAGHPTARRL
jgi:hypothetical protein